MSILNLIVRSKLEWGCPNGTKYPPRQPILNRAILPNRARVYRQMDGQGDSSIPPPNFVAGGIISNWKHKIKQYFETVLKGEWHVCFNG